jgi:hypothetical protein
MRFTRPLPIERRQDPVPLGILSLLAQRARDPHGQAPLAAFRSEAVIDRQIDELTIRRRDITGFVASSGPKCASLRPPGS